MKLLQVIGFWNATGGNMQAGSENRGMCFLWSGQVSKIHLLLEIRHDALQVNTPHLDLFRWGVSEV